MRCATCGVAYAPPADRGHSDFAERGSSCLGLARCWTSTPLGRVCRGPVSPRTEQPDRATPPTARTIVPAPPAVRRSAREPPRTGSDARIRTEDCACPLEAQHQIPCDVRCEIPPMIFLDRRQRAVVPAVIPEEPKKRRTRRAIGSTSTEAVGWNRARSAQDAQCVATRRPSSRPAAPSRKAPVQIEAKRPACVAAARSQPVISWVVQVRGLPPPATIRFSTGNASSVFAQLGRKPIPALVVTGPAVGPSGMTS